MTAKERAAETMRFNFVSAEFESIAYRAIEAAMARAIEAAVLEEREACLNEIAFMKKEHCATKGEERGMELCYGKIKSRGQP